MEQVGFPEETQAMSSFEHLDDNDSNVSIDESHFDLVESNVDVNNESDSDVEIIETTNDVIIIEDSDVEIIEDTIFKQEAVIKIEKRHSFNQETGESFVCKLIFTFNKSR